MTGYGRNELIFEGKKYFCEVKSLNHRFLDISLRIPKFLSNLENWIKEIISRYVIRGKIDVTIIINGFEDLSDKKIIEIDRDALNHYFNLLSNIKKELRISDEIKLKDILEFKDIFVVSEREVDLEKEKTPLEKVICETLMLLVKMREEEGVSLELDFTKRIQKIEERLQKIERFSKNMVIYYRTKLKERIKELVDDISLDDYRIEHEVAIYADKCNITEEIVRFKSHLKQLSQFCKSSGAVGKKMDFMLQECSREANTIASKSSSSETSHLIVEIKALVEEMREQASNIE